MAQISGDALERPEFSKPVKVLIVAAPFYRAVADALITGAEAELKTAGAGHELVEVPGSLEIPSAVALASRQANFDGFVALGCIIRGETSHYDLVCAESARGLTLLGLDGVCIGNGILTVEDMAQATTRADPEGADKGGGAAAACLHLIALKRRWGGARGGVGFTPGSYRIAGRDEGARPA